MASNISSVSFKRREHLLLIEVFDWTGFLLPMFFLAWSFLLLNCSARRMADSFVLFLYLSMLNDLLRFAYCFHLFLCNFWVFNSFCHTLLLYMMFCRRQFLFIGQVFLLIQLHFRMFWFTGLFNFFFDYLYYFFYLMLGLQE